MPPTLLEKIALGLSGLTALGIGAAILFAPHAFYTSYGITLGENASLLSELRAFGAGLAAFGALMLAGIWRRTILMASVTLSLTVFIAFPAGRLLSLASDGMPSGGILGAMGAEIAVAALSVFAFRRRLWQRHGSPSAQPTL